MKKYLMSLGIFTFFIMLIPCLAFVIKPQVNASEDIQSFKTYYNEYYLDKQDEPTTEAEEAEPEKDAEPVKEPDEMVFKVMDYQTKKVTDVPVRDYVIGAVCAEMPASFHDEALKAQAVAAHTYALRQREKEIANPTKELNGAYFSNDPSKYQAYFTKEQAKDFYGDSFDENYAKISKAVDSVIDKVIMYQDEPIVAAFHSMSSGRTEDASVIWGTNVDYLVPVESKSDTEVESYLNTSVMTSDEVKARISTAYTGTDFSGDCSRWIRIVERSDSGTVMTVIAGDRALTGIELREILNLRSPNFDVSYADGEFTFTTRGYGHGVGLSQYGANAMAADGSTYDEILLYYYKGVNIVDI